MEGLEAYLRKKPLMTPVAFAGNGEVITMEAIQQFLGRMYREYIQPVQHAAFTHWKAKMDTTLLYTSAV